MRRSKCDTNPNCVSSGGRVWRCGGAAVENILFLVTDKKVGITHLPSLGGLVPDYLRIVCFPDELSILSNPNPEPIILSARELLFSYIPAYRADMDALSPISPDLPLNLL